MSLFGVSLDQETTPQKTNESPLKRDDFNRKYIFQPSFFRGYVSFQVGKSLLFLIENAKVDINSNDIHVDLHLLDGEIVSSIPFRK